MKNQIGLLDKFKEYETETNEVVGGYLIKKEMGMDMVPNGHGGYNTYFDWGWYDSETGEFDHGLCHQLWNGGSDSPEGINRGGDDPLVDIAVKADPHAVAAA